MYLTRFMCFRFGIRLLLLSIALSPLFTNTERAHSRTPLTIKDVPSPTYPDVNAVCEFSNRYKSIKPFSSCVGIAEEINSEVAILKDKLRALKKAQTAITIPENIELSGKDALIATAGNVREAKSKLIGVINSLRPDHLGKMRVLSSEAKALVQKKEGEHHQGITPEKALLKAAKVGPACDQAAVALKNELRGPDDRDEIQQKIRFFNTNCGNWANNGSPYMQGYGLWRNGYKPEGFSITSNSDQALGYAKRAIEEIKSAIRATTELLADLERNISLGEQAARGLETYAKELETLAAAYEDPQKLEAARLEAAKRLETERRLAEDKRQLDAALAKCNENEEGKAACIASANEMYGGTDVGFVDPRAGGTYTTVEAAGVSGIQVGDGDDADMTLQMGTGRIKCADPNVCGFDTKFDTSNMSAAEWEEYIGTTGVAETLGENYKKDWTRDQYIEEIEKRYGADVAAIFKGTQCGASCSNPQGEALQRVLGTNLIDGNVGKLTMAQALKDGIPPNFVDRYKAIYNEGTVVDAVPPALERSINRALASPSSSVTQTYGGNIRVLEDSRFVSYIADGDETGVDTKALTVAIGTTPTAKNIYPSSGIPNSPLDGSVRRLTGTEFASMNHKDVSLYSRLFVHPGDDFNGPTVHLCPKGTVFESRQNIWSCYSVSK